MHEIDFLPPDKLKNVLQTHRITLGVHSQVCLKYLIQKFLQYLKVNVIYEVGFCLLIIVKDFFILDACGQACPNYPR